MKSYLVSILFLSLPIAILGGQGESSGQAAATADAKPANRITLDVVVNDKSGTPVAGLQQQDFTVLDNRQPQSIVSFESVRQTTAGEAESEVVLIIDSVNTGFGRVAYEREQVTKFLKQDAGRLARPVSIGFFSDTGLDMQQASSRDGNALAEYLNQHDTALRSIRRSQGFYGAAERSELSIRALTGLVEFEEKRPGRKTVIWISPGWPLLSGPNVTMSSKEQQGIFDTIVALSTQLRQSRTTLYSVDPLGTDESTSRTFYYEQFLKPVKEPKQVQYGDLALQVLAHQSGGRILNSNNDVAGEIARCTRDANASYTLSFEGQPGDGPNAYHAIEVKLAKPGLKAQTPTGYYAQPTRVETH